jgi:hypothetical protein
MKKIFPILLIAVTAAAQKPADVRISQVNDRRSSGSFAQLTLLLELPAMTAASVAASRVLVTAAKDDAGTDLMDAEQQEPMLEENFRKEGVATVSLNLKSPARSASKVVEAKGEIELFMPGKDPNSTAELTKFLPGNGKPVTNKALKANGVEITFMTAAQLDADNAKREEWQRITLEENDLAVRIKDPQKRIQGLTYIDSKGEEQRLNDRDAEGVTIFSNWAGKPGPDWKLRVNMKTAKNTLRMPFVVRDVALP